MIRSIVRRREDDFDIYSWKGEADLWPLVRSCINEDLGQETHHHETGVDLAVNGEELRLRPLKMGRKRQVYRLDVGGDSYIVKRTSLRTLGFKHLFPRSVGLTYYTNVMRKVGAARDRGCDAVQDAFLVAEGWVSFFKMEVWLLLRYLPGESLSVTGRGRREDVLRSMIIPCLEEMFRYGLTTNDLNPSNFIDSGDRVRMIDVACQPLFRLQKAKMIRKLFLRYGIRFPVAGVFDAVLQRVLNFLNYPSRKDSKGKS